jgi:dTDP-4-amino-4,6-dideoxygalactose transaminase
VAAELCGFQPYLADIGAANWMLDPDSIAGHPLVEQIGLVIPVAPFGRPVPQEPWIAFSEKTGIPVVIDGAACFDRLISGPRGFVGPIPVAMSFHATKAFATGEGGGVVSTDAALIRRVVRALNFGFDVARDSRAASINGKMSEYHAALGHAELDDWDQRHDAMLAVAHSYRQHLVEAALADRFVGPPDISMSYSLFRCLNAAESSRVQKQLLRLGIGWRLWYGTGLQHQTYYAHLPHGNLRVTEAIAPCLLGIPTAIDLTEGQVARVVSALAEGVAKPRRGHASGPGHFAR